MATRPDEGISATDDPRTVVEIEGRYYILATSTPADENDRVLKHGESFAIFDRWGDIRPVGLAEEGLFHRGTRYLSGLRLRIGDERPLLLGSTTRRDNSRLTIDLTNPDMTLDGRLVRSGTVHLSRSKVLWAGACHEKIEIRNFGERTIWLPITLRFAADYADIFEVRGMQRPARGTVHEPRNEDGAIVLSYDGLDEVRRTTRIGFSPTPDLVGGREAAYRIELEPGRSVNIELRIDCDPPTPPHRPSFSTALDRATSELQGRFDRSARVTTSSELFDDWVGRSQADLVMMTSETAHGSYPYAGVPWFSTVFGRDGMLYMTVGERNDRTRAQNTAIHGGKVLRLKDDGTVPPDNPFVGRTGFKPEIYSYGHRNIQGLTIHPETGVIWATEHGPQGGDELNTIQAGKNYGWPISTFGREYTGEFISPPALEGVEQPVIFWAPSPGLSGMAFYTGDRIPGWKGSLLVGALSGQQIQRVVFTEKGPIGREALLGSLRLRVRDVRQGPDGLVYVAVDANPGGVLRIEPASAPTTASGH